MSQTVTPPQSSPTLSAGRFFPEIVRAKIGRCFITDIAEPEGSLSIVQAVVNIAADRQGACRGRLVSSLTCKPVSV